MSPPLDTVETFDPKAATGIYVHWPFCVSKCPYCDFNSHVRDQIDEQAWHCAYLQDLEAQSKLVPPHPVQSVFFGGGTPSLMSPSLVDAILNKIHQVWGFKEGIEITLEANPNSTEVKKLKEFKTAGINRLSLGIQSLDPEVLTFLGRAHSQTEAQTAINAAQTLYPGRFSLDFIYAHPKHTPAQWQQELQNILLNYQPNHLSLYQLTIEPQTPFQSYERLGHFKMPTALASEQFYDQTHDIMKQNGYGAYEVSNFAQSGFESQHNLIYWRYGDYFGIGPGAHGRLTQNQQKVATRAHRSPERWLELIQTQGTAFTHQIKLSRFEMLEERLLMGLRLEEGIPYEQLNTLTTNGFWATVGESKQTALNASGDIIPDTEALRLSATGRKRLNKILDFILINAED